MNIMTKEEEKEYKEWMELDFRIFEHKYMNAFTRVPVKALTEKEMKRYEYLDELTKKYRGL